MSVCVYFRASAGPSIGIGHVMRACTLARAVSIRGWKTYLVLDSGTTDWVHERISDNPFNEIFEEGVLSRISDGDSILVIDSYESAINNWKNTCNFHKTISIVDPNITPDFGTDLSIHQSLTPSTNTGNWLNQVIVDDFFFGLSERRSVRTRNDVPKILISAGSTDPFGYCAEISRILKTIPEEFEAVFVSSENFNRMDKRFSQIPFGNLYRNQLEDVDLAIVAAGTTGWEMYAANIPFCYSALYENQVANYETLRQCGIGVPLGGRIDELFDISEPDLRNAISRIGQLESTLSPLRTIYPIRPISESIDLIFG